MVVRVLALCACLFIAAPAIAKDAPAKPVKAKKSCRRDTVTGSIMPLSTCHTAEEWAQIDALHQENVEQYRTNQDRALQSGSGGLLPGKAGGG